MKLKKYFKLSTLGLVLIIGIWGYIFYRNYIPDTWLIGWDSLHTEFNVSLNLKRTISSAWAEYQGLGAPSAHSHASDLPRILIVGILDVLFTTNSIRYIYILLCLLIGGLGFYKLANETSLVEGKQVDKRAIVLGTLFYMLNIGTVQHFILPFEMFNTQFAALPWLFLYIIKYIKNDKKRFLLYFGLATFLATPMAYASMLWIAYFVAICVYLITILFQQYSRKLLRKSLLLVTSTLVINAFWLLPTIYYTIKHSRYVSAAKTNQLFSEEAFMTNQKFGNIKDILLLKGYLFDWSTYGMNKFEPAMTAWHNHISSIPFIIISFVFVALCIWGIKKIIQKGTSETKAYVSVFLLSFAILLGINTPLVDILESTAVIGEALRFPFTKFSLLLIFTYSLFITIAIDRVFELIHRYEKDTKVYSSVTALILLGLLIIYSFPAFNGYFIHPAIKKEIPNEYFELFEYMSKQDPNTRIANLPIDSLFGWYYTDWGYQGSGYLWYGIQQPILDRDFDRWYTYNEDYYDQMSTAVYTRDKAKIEEILDKYAIDWILLDKSHVKPGLSLEESNNQMAYEEIQRLLDETHKVSLDRRIGKDLFIYKITDTKDNSYIEMYHEDENGKPLIRNSIFSRTNFERKKGIVQEHDQGDYLTYEKVINTSDNSEHKLTFPNLIETENKLLSTVYVRKAKDKYEMKLKYSIPQISINGSNYTSPNAYEIPLANPLNQPPTLLSLGEQYLKIPNIGENWQEIGELMISTKEKNSLDVYTTIDKQEIDVTARTIQSIDNCSTEMVNSELSNTEYLAQGISLKSTNKNLCVHLKTKISLSKNYLSYLGFTSDSSHNIEPNICLQDNQGCQEYSIVEEDGSRFGLYFENPTKSEYSTTLILDNLIPKRTAYITYEDLENINYQKITTKNIDIKSIESSLQNLYKDITLKPVNNQFKVSIRFRNSQIYTYKLDKLQRLSQDQNINCKQNDTDNVISKKFNDDYISYSSTDSFICENFDFYNLSIGMGYIVSIKAKNIEGAPLLFSINDKNYSQSFYSSRFPKTEAIDQEFAILPTLSDIDTSAINVFINNQSIGNKSTSNSLYEIKFTPIPYQWLNSIKISKETNYAPTNDFEVEKLNTFLYKIKLNNQNKDTIIKLNQNFEKNWVAVYSNGKMLDRNGVSSGEKLNTDSWQNLWENRGKTNTIYIIYLPQILQYLGFVVLIIYFYSFVVLASLINYKKIKLRSL